MADEDFVRILQEQRKSEQTIQNFSFDDEFKLAIVELAGYDATTDTIKRVSVDSLGRLNVIGALSTTPAIPKSQTHIFITPSSSSAVNLTTQATKCFSIQVKSTGGLATSWEVVLEGSNDSTNFDTLITHTNSRHNDGALVFTGANSFPVLYMRIRVIAVILGAATDISVTIIGVP